MERRIYLYYTVMQCNLERDRDSAIEENGTQYVPIIDSDCPFTCVDDIRTYISDTFTEGFIENSEYPELLDGDMPRYIDHDGKLYVLNGDGGGNENWAYGNMEIQIEGDKISASFEGLDCYESPISAKVVLAKEGNVWKIDECAITSEFGTETNR